MSYIGYVWTAYGVSALAIVVTVLLCWRAYHKYLKRIQDLAIKY